MPSGDGICNNLQDSHVEVSLYNIEVHDSNPSDSHLLSEFLDLNWIALNTLCCAPFYRGRVCQSDNLTWPHWASGEWLTHGRALS